ncbi:MAG TPA: cupin domain-containing protein [Terriglobales bacterium]|jgi:quercetin dioxygenase-like cupin family protein
MKLSPAARFFAWVVASAFVISLPGQLNAQATEDKPIVATAASAKFGAIPNAPECFTIAVEKGDPGTGPSVILAKFAPGCVAPWHWHTPSETVMMVSGSLEVQMKDDKPFVAHRGDFVYMPGHHVHRATCMGSVPCLVFLTSDAAFDVHWVDAEGQEIPLAKAMENAKASKKGAAKQH